MIATPQQSLEAAAALARAAGVDAHILSDEIEGERARWARCMRRWRARWRARQPFAALRDPVRRRDHGDGARKGGRGGRATEFLLGCAIALQGEPGVHVLAADTDGIDGIEDNAGAVVTPDTLARARRWA
jgi:glycerate 2-kinase